jgi:membrane protease subunit HflK
VIAAADGDASRFKQILVEYNRAPAVTRERMYLETVQQIMSSTSKVMIDARGGGNLLMLPLDKILQMPAGAAGDGTGARPAEAPAVPEPPARARDSLRSRDREGRP